MNQKQGEGNQSNSETSDESYQDRVPRRNRWNWSFWAEHPIGIIASALGLFLIAPAEEFVGHKTKIWLVGLGVWLLIGAVIAFVCDSIISTQAPAGELPSKASPTVHTAPNITTPASNPASAPSNAPSKKPAQAQPSTARTASDWKNRLDQLRAELDSLKTQSTGLYHVLIELKPQVGTNDHEDFPLGLNRSASSSSPIISTDLQAANPFENPSIIRQSIFHGDEKTYRAFLQVAQACGKTMLAIPLDMHNLIPEYIRPLFQSDCVINNRALVWMYMLHRMGWNAKPGDLAVASRWFWNGNSAFSYSTSDFVGHPLLARWNTGRFYSVLGDDGTSQTDVCRMSVWAIDQLLGLHSKPEATEASLPISKDNLGRSFQVLHDGLGHWTKDQVFTEREFYKEHIPPIPHPSEDAKEAAKEYHDGLINRLIGLKAIRVVQTLSSAFAPPIPPVTRGNPGRTFEVLHLSVGIWKQGDLFTDFDFRHLFLPKINSGNEPRSEQFCNDYLERWIRQDAIRPILPAAAQQGA